MADTLLKPNDIGTVEDPVNLAIMDVDAFIQDNKCLPVTNPLMFEPSTNLFHPDGLYSDLIFGPTGSPERMLRFGYIDLNTQIFHPKIYKLIGQLGILYTDIMKGQAYAIFNPETQDFERVMGDPFIVEGADTGYSFFLKHFFDLKFRTTDSSKRDERIEVIEQYKSRALIDRYLVEPAGLRDIASDSSGRLVQDDINKLYISLMLYARSIPKGSTSPLRDPIRYQLQSKAQEIFDYLENILDGKRGFVQGHFARRKVAMSTRNVITAAPFIAGSPDDPQLLRADEVMVGVYQTMKGLQPFTKYGLNTIFINPIFKTEAVSQIALSDLKTKELVYTTITPAERDKWISADNQDKIINSFRNTELRRKPVLIKDKDNKDYALCLVYDLGDEIILSRSIDDLQARWPRLVDKSRLRPLTYIEMFYLITEAVSKNKHVIVTRYPVIEQGSSYVAIPHIVSTTPSRKVTFYDLLSPYDVTYTLKQYPVLNAPFMDAAMVHPSKLGGLGGDHDGDKCSLEYIWTADANKECSDYLNKTRSVINTDLRFITGSGVYLTDIFLHNLTY